MTRWFMQVLTVIVLLMQTSTTTPVWAGIYVDLAGGFTQFTCTICEGDNDGTWRQAGLPNGIRRTSPAFRAGLGYRWEQWSIQAHYLNAGQVKIHQYYTTDDASYDKVAHKCLANCATPNSRFETSDSYQGGELSLSKHFRIGPVQPFLRAGGAVLFHALQVNFGATHLTMHGTIPMVLVGGGLCYHWLCGETTYYKGSGGGTEWSAGLPISKEMVVSLVSLKIPL